MEGLRNLLEAAVKKNKFIEKYGMQADYGMSADLGENPLAQMNHAECLLALHMMFVEGVPERVEFLDAEKKEVLSSAKE